MPRHRFVKVGRWLLALTIVPAALVPALRRSSTAQVASAPPHSAALPDASAPITSLDAATAVDARAEASDGGPAPSSEPVLVPLTSVELAALRPLALRGAAILVRDADAGASARITVVVRARAPMATVLRVIATPEQYPTFMPTLSGVDVLSRGHNRTAFRFHVAAAIFDVSILSAAHVVNDHRVDVAIVRSDIGPGASRWDLTPDGDGTLVALSTWGDPSRGAWLLRQIAQRSSSAIAAMNISTDVLLLLSAARRAETLAGRSAPLRPPARELASGPLAPPASGPWTALARDNVVASIALDPTGAFVQTTVAAWTPLSPAAVRARLEDAAHYDSVWSAIDGVRVVADQGATQRLFLNVRSALSHTSGEMERVVEAGASGGSTVVWWRGVSGDFANASHRWDVAPLENGAVVMLTGGSELTRAGWITRALIDRDPWLLPGYAASWKMVWMRPLLDPP